MILIKFVSYLFVDESAYRKEAPTLGIYGYEKLLIASVTAVQSTVH